MLRRSRTGLRLWALLVLVLFAFDAVGPVFAALAGSKAKSQFVEICTPDGMKRIAVADASGEPIGSNAECFKCPLCAPNGAHGAIDAPRAHSGFADGWSHAVPSTRDSQSPEARFLPSPPSRGPPLHA
jgi:hypothetical protein